MSLFRQVPSTHNASGSEVKHLSEESGTALPSSLRSCLRVLGYRATNTATIEHPPTKEYSGDAGNQDFWQDIHTDRLWDGRRIELLRFNLTEWVPLQPGLFHAAESAASRGVALRYAAFNTALGLHFKPYGKVSMLESGVGCARLGAVRHDNKVQYILGASFSQSCDEGIPLIVDATDYEMLAERIRDLGAVCASLYGRIRLLPAATWDMTQHFDQKPSYCISVESMNMEKSRAPQSMLAAVYITFTNAKSVEPRSGQWATSYCQFRPGSRYNNITEAVRWLRAYTEHYSNKGCRIIADFDAYHSYFDNTDLPLPERLRVAYPRRRFNHMLTRWTSLSSFMEILSRATSSRILKSRQS